MAGLKQNNILQQSSEKLHLLLADSSVVSKGNYTVHAYSYSVLPAQFESLIPWMVKRNYNSHKL